MALLADGRDVPDHFLLQPQRPQVADFGLPNIPIFDATLRPIARLQAQPADATAVRIAAPPTVPIGPRRRTMPHRKDAVHGELLS